MSGRILRNHWTGERERATQIECERFFAYALTNVHKNLIIGWMIMERFHSYNEVKTEVQTRQEAIDYMAWRHGVKRRRTNE